MFGIRSEDIQHSKFLEINDDKNIIDAKVEIIEDLGSETNIHLSSLSNNFTARFNQRIDLNIKDSISVLFDVNQGHFFDMRSENIL